MLCAAVITTTTSTSTWITCKQNIDIFLIKNTRYLMHLRSIWAGRQTYNKSCWCDSWSGRYQVVTTWMSDTVDR